ncbi:MAG: cysteine desulfurase / selenocysteine lyase [Thermoplasmata archaeon]|nr:cysteine desulfurase / selenocysteine lyase [Thermoplasmata archaeon]
MAFDLARVRSDFPITRRTLRTRDGADRPLVYLDHGVTTHPPQEVLDQVVAFCSSSHGAVPRGSHTLSRESSDAFDDATRELARFVGADPATQPVLLGQSTTQMLDLAAHLVAHRPGVTLTTLAEHHSNDLPHRKHGPVVHAAIDDDGRLDLDDVERKLQQHQVKLFAVTGAGNVTGLQPDLPRLARLAHDAGALILADAAQLLAHAPIDVKPAGHPEHIDLLAGVAHKCYAPFGSAMLAAPVELTDEAPPYLPGGGTVQWVDEGGAQFKLGRDRHMGGTPHTVGAVAFAAATRYLSRLGMAEVQAHEARLTRQALRRFEELEADHGVRVLGPSGAGTRKLGVFTFLVPGREPAEVAAQLDQDHAIAVRNGSFCAHPILNRLMGRPGGSPNPAATRATFGVFNTQAEVDLMADAVAEVARQAKAGVPLAATGAKPC